MFLNKYFPVKYWNLGYFPIGGLNNAVLTINNISRLNIVQESTINITDNLNSRNTCSFITIPDSSFVPLVGQEIIIEAAPCEGAKFVRLFGGTINRIKKRSKFQGAPKFYALECVDFNQLADKRLVRKVFPRQPVRDVIIDIVESYMDGENITTKNVGDTGFFLEKSVFAYKKVTEAFNDISRITGQHWFIDYFRDLHFFLRSTTRADLIINETNNPPLEEFCAWLDDKRNKVCPGIKWSNLSVVAHREQLANKMWQIAGNDTTEEREDEFDGDGNRRTFTLKYSLADLKRNADGTLADDAIILTPGGNVGAANIGLRDIDTGKEWYFTKGEKEIVQDDDETPIPTGTRIEVFYQGLRPIVVEATNDTEIGKRKNIELNSGLYEYVEDDESIESEAFAIQRADGHVRRFGPVPTIVSFTTDQAILFSSQLINIELPEFEITGNEGQGDEFLIDSVETQGLSTVTDKGKDTITWRQTANCVSGEHLGGWQDFFRTLEKFGRQLKLRQQTALLLTETIKEFIDIEQRFNLTTPLGPHFHPCEECWPIGFAVVGKSPHCKAEFNRLGLE